MRLHHGEHGVLPLVRPDDMVQPELGRGTRERRCHQDIVGAADLHGPLLAGVFLALQKRADPDRDLDRLGARRADRRARGRGRSPLPRAGGPGCRRHHTVRITPLVPRASSRERAGLRPQNAQSDPALNAEAGQRFLPGPGQRHTALTSTQSAALDDARTSRCVNDEDRGPGDGDRAACVASPVCRARL